VGPERLRDLHRERPYGSPRTDDQHLLPGLHLPLVAECLEGGEAGGGDSRRLLEAEVRGLGRDLVLPSGGVLGEGAGGDAEHLIAGLEPRDILADLLDATCRINAPDPGLGPAEPEAQDAEQVRQTRHDVPVADVRTRRVNAEQHLAAANHRFVDICEL
jgi:hypothetical protein